MVIGAYAPTDNVMGLRKGKFSKTLIRDYLFKNSAIENRLFYWVILLIERIERLKDLTKRVFLGGAKALTKLGFFKRCKSVMRSDHQMYLQSRERFFLLHNKNARLGLAKMFL